MGVMSCSILYPTVFKNDVDTNGRDPPQTELLRNALECVSACLLAPNSQTLE